ncbi:MAG: hypothetical protein KJZ85_13915 [Rhodobacteraceae bacterium]|jgi:L-arabinose isomerase|nr:hypothetical protein [Paracoccaceae bacterium]
MRDAGGFSVAPGLARRPARVAVLSGYMPFFEEVLPAGFRAGMAARAEATAARLGDAGEVLFAGLVTDHDSGRAAGRRIAAFAPDAVVIAPTMAAPAGYQAAALAEVGRLPLVILNIAGIDTVGPDFTAHSIMPNSVPVGCMMINNLLRREGRRAPVVSGPASDPDTWSRARAAVAAAAVAGRLMRARLGVMGAPLDGYLNVVCDPAALERATGTQLVDIPAAEVTDAWRAVGAPQVAALAAAYRARMPLDAATAASADFRDALRLALALEAVVLRHRLDGGTFNCRNEYSVGNPEIGVLGCLALAHLTTHGLPFTCTGDTVTAVAMLLGKLLGGDTLYCELDSPDYRRDAVLCANTGEGDFRQAASCGACRIAVSGQESGRNARGCAVGYDVDERDGTAIAFTPRAGDPGGHAILCAEGRIEPPPPTGLKLPHLMFRFRGMGVGEGMSRWIAAGATHHAGISSGHHGAALQAVAMHLGIGAERVA